LICVAPFFQQTKIYSDLPPKAAREAVEVLVNLLLAHPSVVPDTLACGALRPLVELGLSPVSPALAVRVMDVLASALQSEPLSACAWPVDVFRHLAALVAADRNLWVLQSTSVVFSKFFYCFL
jgi:hypothetical protein